MVHVGERDAFGGEDGVLGAVDMDEPFVVVAGDDLHLCHQVVNGWVLLGVLPDKVHQGKEHIVVFQVAGSFHLNGYQFVPTDGA